MCIGRLKLSKGVKLSGIGIFSLGDGLIDRVTSKKLKIENFQVGGLRLFHNG